MPAVTTIIRMHSIRRIASMLLLTAAGYGTMVTVSAADLTSRYQAGEQSSSQLRSRIQAETNRIQGFEGTIGALQGRLTAVEHSVAIQEGLLGAVSNQLDAARLRLSRLRVEYARDLSTMAAQLRADYETPPPTLVGVVVNSGGFSALLTGLSDLTTIERHNTQIVVDVRAARAAVETQARRLAQVLIRRRRATAAVIVERDTIAQLKVSIVDRELTVVHARDRDAGRLRALHATLVHEAQILDQRAAEAQTLSSGGAVAPPGGCTNTPFVPHGGEFGFFPAPGTNYTVNEEPVIAARLDQLGQALQLHLIGISGYRTPQHSVEVGGFADDPHTRGEASDTPGVEGVPESTLEEFCLTRPFPGAREADHIQEL
jgi:uncharacterized coiled-coil protein SlyX